jgi:hypothetical protein
MIGLESKCSVRLRGRINAQYFHLLADIRELFYDCPESLNS